MYICFHRYVSICINNLRPNPSPTPSRFVPFAVGTHPKPRLGTSLGRQPRARSTSRPMPAIYIHICPCVCLCV